METVDLDMDDLFDVRGDVDDDAAFPRSPTGFEDNEAGEPGEAAEGGENEENEGEIQSQVIAKLRDMSKGASKKVVTRPQPKLDADRLNGDRGIPVLPKIFEDFKMKGPGHEIEDLKRMMQKMEHWAHRLFPKMTFDEVIERVEKLGGKKAVQTTIKKIRLDIPLLDDDFVDGADELGDDANNDNVIHNGFPEEDDLIDGDAENVLNEMMREDTSFSEPITPVPKTTPGMSETPSTPVLSQTPQPETSTTMNDEMRERMERNKRLAMERRQARMKGLTPAKTDDPTTPLPSSQQSQMTETPQRIVTDSQETQSDKPVANNQENSENDLNLFVEPTPGASSLATETVNSEKSEETSSETVTNKESETLQDMDIGETLCGEGQDSEKVTSAEKRTETEAPSQCEKSEDFHLFVEPTVNTCSSDPDNVKVGESLKNDAEASQSAKDASCESDSAKGNNSESLHLHIEATEALGDHASVGEKSEKKEDNSETEEFQLRLDSTEESQEDTQEDMDLADDDLLLAAEASAIEMSQREDAKQMDCTQSEGIKESGGEGDTASNISAMETCKGQETEKMSCTPSKGGKKTGGGGDSASKNDEELSEEQLNLLLEETEEL